MKKKTLLVRLDPDLHKKIRLASVEHEFSLNSFVVNAFKEYLNNIKSEKGK